MTWSDPWPGMPPDYETPLTSQANFSQSLFSQLEKRPFKSKLCHFSTSLNVLTFISVILSFLFHSFMNSIPKLLSLFPWFEYCFEFDSISNLHEPCFLELEFSQSFSYCMNPSLFESRAFPKFWKFNLKSTTIQKKNFQNWYFC